MKIKIIKNLNIKNGPIITAGEICKVRVYCTMPLQFNAPFQVIEGDYSGHFIPREYCIEHSEEKMFTEEQVQNIENVHLAKLQKLSAEKDRAIDLVTEVSKQLLKKNEQIRSLEIIVSALTIGLTASSEAIQVLKEKEKV